MALLRISCTVNEQVATPDMEPIGLIANRPNAFTFCAWPAEAESDADDASRSPRPVIPCNSLIDGRELHSSYVACSSRWSKLFLICECGLRPTGRQRESSTWEGKQ